MCIFSLEVEAVSGTKIFASMLPDGRQVIVYEMAVASEHESLAMVLPIPAVDDERAGVEFIDLSSCADFFERVEKVYFPKPTSRSASLASKGMDRSAPPMLEVHVVGDFRASYVPNPQSFVRLASEFTLPTRIIQQHSAYENFGFAVFRLSDVSKRVASRRHPMAFAFRPQEFATDKLFYPCLHLHDGGDVSEVAEYDHTLYAQAPIAWEREFPEVEGELRAVPLGAKNLAFVWRNAKAGRWPEPKYLPPRIVSPNHPVCKATCVGEQPNEDFWVNLTTPDQAGQCRLY